MPRNLPYALQILDEKSREELLKIENDYFGGFIEREDEHVGLDENCEQVPRTSSKSLSSIFKKHQRVGRVRELKLNNDKKEEEEAVIPIAISTTEEDTVFNSKLCWLNNTPAMMTTATDVAIPTLDFPELSASNNRIITKMCPKVNNGFKCHNVNCNYQHPPVEETKKIVSDMRSLKKRVVKDVLKVMDTPPTSTSAGKQSNGKSKLCKFQDKCKFKATCTYAHSKDEITVNPCQFGAKCKLIKNEGNIVVNNVAMKKKCGFIHPKESKEMYLTRHK